MVCRRLCWFIPCLYAAGLMAAEDGLVGHWRLLDDCRDYSGLENHGRNLGVDLATGSFNGQGASIEVPSSLSLQRGTGDFTIALAIKTSSDGGVDCGSLVSQFDPSRRRGFDLALGGNSSGYNAQGRIRQLVLGLDSATPGVWADCGRPGGKTHSSDALTVFNGQLFVGTTDGVEVAEWAHVYRYLGQREWEDCGRLGNGRTRGVYAMVVHQGELFAATSASHGRQPPEMSFGRVYRYLGGQQWEDLGQPGENYRLNSLATYRGKLYVTGFNIGPDPGHVYEYLGNQQWKACGEFQGWPHTLVVHDGKLFTAYPQGEVFAYDGSAWEPLGNPFGSLDECNQIHSMGIYHGELYAGSWPKGKVAVRRNGAWVDLGRLGDATEVVGLAVYNGSFYAGTIPRAELFRYGGPGDWTSLRRLFDPPGYEPVPVGSGAKEVEDWSRASSLGVFNGKLFVATATCHRTRIDPPRADEVRGKVFSFSTGSCISYDRDLGDGWQSVAAVRRGKQLELYVQGQLVSRQAQETSPLDVSVDVALRIGFGPQGYFRGQLREVRLYHRALESAEIRTLSESHRGRNGDAPPGPSGDGTSRSN